MKVIIDCNVWISFLLGFQKELMHDILTNENMQVFVCPELTHEIDDVASRAKISIRISEEDIEQLFRLIRAYCTNAQIEKRSATDIRDTKDLYLLSFAETIDADYIITGDKDLLVLNNNQGTKILSPSQFKLIL